MKKIEIDTNFNFLGPCYPTLSLDEVRKLKLIVGEKIIVFQDNDEWNGIVCHDKTLPQMYQWYIKLPC